MAIRQKSQFQSYRFFVNSNFGIFQKSQRATRLLWLTDKMCEYIINPASIVQDTERTPFHQQTDGVNPLYTPFNYAEVCVCVCVCVCVGGGV